MTFDVLTGDVLDALPTLEAESFDAMLTDPPYGLEFMGREWDRVVPGADVWREALRVLKPGAFALVFGGTRTFHRLAIALEDAGFELRDTLMWVYSQGFPKSHNFGCRCEHDHSAQGAQQTTEHHVRGVRRFDVPTPLQAGGGEGSVLQSSVPQPRTPAHRAEGAAPLPTGCEESGLEGRSDLQAEEGQLRRPEVCAMPGAILTNGPEGRLRDGAPASDGAAARTVLDPDRGGASPQPQPKGQSAGKPGTVPQQRSTQTGRGAEATCPTCGGLTDWQGYGTALKPAWEPVLLVRKPTGLTFAETALAHGCGALNIDGTRVPVADRAPYESNASGDRGHADNRARGMDFGMTAGSADDLGRWPANLIHDGSDEVVSAFPSAPGQQGAVGPQHGPKPSVNAYGDYGPRQDFAPRLDTGSAARFFYAAKASTEERDEGLHQFAPQAAGVKNGSGRGYSAGDPYAEVTYRNPHPTVKPLALTEYLARLLLPPERDTTRRILTPFSGSGSEMIGALRAGWDEAVGIEREAEYAEIARARLKRWTRGIQLPLLEAL